MKSAKKREDFYDKEIAPALAELGNKCQANGLSFLAVVEFNQSESGDSEYGKTLAVAKGSSDSFLWFDAFVLANANFEKYTMAFVRHVNASGRPHTSIFLERLGINPDPDKRPKPEPRHIVHGVGNRA